MPENIYFSKEEQKDIRNRYGISDKIIIPADFNRVSEYYNLNKYKQYDLYELIKDDPELIKSAKLNTKALYAYLNDTKLGSSTIWHDIHVLLTSTNPEKNIFENTNIKDYDILSNIYCDGIFEYASIVIEHLKKFNFETNILNHIYEKILEIYIYNTIKLVADNDKHSGRVDMNPHEIDNMQKSNKIQHIDSILVRERLQLALHPHGSYNMNDTEVLNTESVVLVHDGDHMYITKSESKHSRFNFKNLFGKKTKVAMNT